VPAGWVAARRSEQTPIHPLRVCAALQPHVDRGAILVVHGGEFGQWLQAGVEAAPRLINGVAGAIGAAIPMALAARLRHPDRPVIAVLGDGTFGFHAFELDTAARYGLPVVTIVGNDARWNAEHQLQLQHYGADRTVGCALRPSRYDQMAAALGARQPRARRRPRARARPRPPRQHPGHRQHPDRQPRRPHLLTSPEMSARNVGT
jgi:acetolactate synthase-1/2/3 large subunit